MHERCAACGLRYEREQGYFVGAICIALGALVPVVFFRYARSLWLSLDYLLTLADERREQARLRSR